METGSQAGQGTQPLQGPLHTPRLLPADGRALSPEEQSLMASESLLGLTEPWASEPGRELGFPSAAGAGAVTSPGRTLRRCTSLQGPRPPSAPRLGPSRL